MVHCMRLLYCNMSEVLIMWLSDVPLAAMQEVDPVTVPFFPLTLRTWAPSQLLLTKDSKLLITEAEAEVVCQCSHGHRPALQAR